MPDKESVERIWERHYDAGVAGDLVYPEKAIPLLVAEMASKRAENTAIEFLGATLTYGAFRSQMMCFAEALTRLGVVPGTRVAIMLPNCPQLMVSLYAALWLGGIVVMTNPLYVERELEHQWNDAGAEVLVILDHLFPRAEKVIPGTRIRKTVVTAMTEAIPGQSAEAYPVSDRLKSLASAFSYGDDVLNYAELLESTPETALECRAALDDVALLQYTGGTTGTPKGVMLTHRNLLCNVVQVTRWIKGIEEGKDRFLSIIPFFHSFGMTVALNLPLVNGCASIVVPRFSALELLKTINDTRPTIFPGVPTLFLAIVNDSKVRSYDISSIRLCITGSAPMPVEAMRRFEELISGVIVEGYGLTEASPVTHINPVEGVRKCGTIGLPLPDTDHRVVDLDGCGRDVAPGEVGELLIRGPQVMKGYWGLAEDTADTVRDGWLYTGDVARVDEDGYVTIVERKKDVVLSLGYNVYPREVEEVLFEHPKILDAATIGVPDANRGEVVKAYIVLRPGEKADAREIISFCRERLAAYKVPRQVEFRDALPKTSVGKISRKDLRLAAREKACRQEEQGS